jgi:receptor expression-enhancing protein 5/6
LWSTIKLAIAAWLVLPQFRGATIIYEHYVRPYFYKSAANVVDKKQQLTDSERKFLSSLSPQARASVADFIDNNGLDAFDKIIATANAESTKRRAES